MFNLLGPLTNPARPGIYLLGVYDAALVEPIAGVLSRLGVQRAMVVYGQDGFDEVSPVGETLACELRDGYLRSFCITPEDYGLPRSRREELLGGSPQENAATLRGILAGDIRDARRSAVAMNAGCALYLGGKVSSIGEGIASAEALIDDGSADRLLARFITACQEG